MILNIDNYFITKYTVINFIGKGDMIMKKRIMICLAAVLTVVFAISVLTACSLKGDDNKGDDNANVEKELNASECSSELNGAIAASTAKDNYSINVTGSAGEGRSSVVNIEYDSDTHHVTVSSTQDYLGVTTNLYTETYLFVRGGKYYISTRASENASFSAPGELGSKTAFDEAAANYLLNSMIGKFTLNDTAEVTYTGKKKGTDSSIEVTTVAEVNGVQTELYTSYTIKNGLVASVFQRVSEYDASNVPTIMTENTVTVRYDIGAVELAAGIQVE